MSEASFTRLPYACLVLLRNSAFPAYLAEHHVHAVRSASRPGEGCR